MAMYKNPECRRNGTDLTIESRRKGSRQNGSSGNGSRRNGSRRNGNTPWHLPMNTIACFLTYSFKRSTSVATLGVF